MAKKKQSLVIDKKSRQMRVSDEMIAEIVRVKDNHGGSLTHKQLYEWARNNKTSEVYKWLDGHGAFDAQKALQFMGLSYCRMLIMRVRIAYPDDHGKVHRIRFLHSLADDRLNGQGYRTITDILSDEQHREQLVETAMGELRAFEKKYAKLQSVVGLAPVFEAIRNLNH